MKNLFLLIAIVFLVSSCSSLKPLSADSTANSSNTAGRQSSLQFIENVTIQPAGNQNAELAEINKKSGVDSRRSVRSNYGAAIEKYSPLQFKYAILEDAPVEDLKNEKLLAFIDDWYGTKYHFGGNGKNGIDCSAFVSTLMSNVYGINNLPRVSRDQFFATAHIPRNQLQEGDLVFFHTYGRRKTITHVGVYLHNNRFIHASISGVMISDMSEGYYASHFVGAGRVFDVGFRDAASNTSSLLNH